MDADTLTDTDEHLPPPPHADMPPPDLHSRAVQVDLAALTHQGKVRSNNEDNLLVVRFGRFLQTLLTSLPEGELAHDFGDTGYGILVADGMGGMAAGEVASRTAIALFVNLVLDTPDWMLKHAEPHVAKVIERASRRFQDVNEAIIELANQLGHRGMGTTLTMACSLGAHLLIAHVGDSPAYLSRAGELHRLTRDHTLAQQFADMSATPLRDAPAPFHHILTQAIGDPRSAGMPDIRRMQLADGDRLLLCTDGLTNMVEDATIAAELRRPAASAEICQALIDRALEGGGKDNVTVVVASYGIPSGPPDARAT